MFAQKKERLVWIRQANQKEAMQMAKKTTPKVGVEELSVHETAYAKHGLTAWLGVLESERDAIRKMYDGIDGLMHTTTFITNNQVDMKKLARYGAHMRLTQIKNEIHLVQTKRIEHLGSSARSKNTIRRGRTMSAAERRSVSARMKKYWAERRKANAKK